MEEYTWCMNIFLLSESCDLREDLQNALRDEISKRGNRIAYISSEPQQGERPYYFSVVKDYKVINNSIEIDYFDLSDAFSDEDLSKLAAYGAVFLSGGNTYTFLDSARRRGLQKILEQILEKNGLLIGVSAGALMMTPTIELAKSENLIGLQDSSGFGFVPFEFFPHYTKENKNFPMNYSTARTVYLCKDGDGIFVSGESVTMFGDIANI